MDKNTLMTASSVENDANIDVHVHGPLSPVVMSEHLSDRKSNEEEIFCRIINIKQISYSIYNF